MSEAIRTVVKAPEGKKENQVSQVQKGKFCKPISSPVEQILFLQRTIGNQAVQKLMKSGVLQAKLRIGSPGDVYEQEADRVADAVMRMPQPQAVSGGSPSIQRVCSKCEYGGLKRQPIKEEDEEKKLQRKPVEEEEEHLQAKVTSGSKSEVNPDLEINIQSLKGGGKPLSENVRAFFEPRFGHDFSGVRVHTDAKAGESAREVNALAYTTGQNVVFGAGRYAPHTNEGRRLLAHELTHVLQQGRGAIMPTLFTGVADTVMTSSNRVVSGFTHAEPSIQRACGPVHIGSPGGCIGMGGDIIGEHYLFRVNCDDFKPGEEAKLRAFAATLSSGGSVKIHGFASIEGEPVFNENLSCARAIKVQSILNSVLIPSGISVSYSLFKHGATAGDREERRSAYIDWLPASPAPSIPTTTPASSFSHSAAAAYARKWALSTNSIYGRFDNDCTNFVSQAMLNGGWTMIGGSFSDRTRNDVWWFGRSLLAKASYTWGGAQNFADFVTTSGRGSRASSEMDLEEGDVLQMIFAGSSSIGHSMVVTGKSAADLFLSYHTSDHLNEPLSAIKSRSHGAIFIPWKIL